MRPDSPRDRRYINHLLTYLLTYLYWCLQLTTLPTEDGQAELNWVASCIPKWLAVLILTRLDVEPVISTILFRADQSLVRNTVIPSLLSFVC